MGADRKTHLLEGVKDKELLLTAKFQGNTSSDMTNLESSNFGGGEIASAVHTGTGAYTLTFRHLYPELKALFKPVLIGTTDGLQCRVLTWDVTAGTATILLEVATSATDPATTDFVHFAWLVRNSGFNA